MKYCKYLNQSINFYYDGMTFCNTLWNHTGYIKYTNSAEENIKNFLSRKTELIELINQKNYTENCCKCPSLETMDKEGIQNINKIKHIEIYHWLDCNCGCFYCSNRNETNLKITHNTDCKGKINIVEHLKELKKHNLLDNNLQINMVGGEATILQEFPDLCDFIIENNIKTNLLSNGILYEQKISDVLNLNNGSFLIVSIDAGTKETFRKIKNVDKFDDVIKNMARYVKETDENSNKIALKYIILENINDNKEEIDKWIEICTSVGIKNLFVTIEFCHSKERKTHQISEHICNMYEYTKKRIKEINPELNVLTYDFVEKFIENRSYNPVAY